MLCEDMDHGAEGMRVMHEGMREGVGAQVGARE